MDSKGFEKFTFGIKRELVAYIRDRAPLMVVEKTLRFIDENFRLQGWQGKVFQPWKKSKGTILVKSGALRRSFNYAPAGLGETRFYSNIIYSGIHNTGGTINKKAHSKTIRHRLNRDGSLMSQATGIGPHRRNADKLLRFAKNSHKNARETTVQVPEHNIIMPKRQFAPYEGNESPVLNNAIISDLEKNINRIFKIQ